MSNRPQEQDSAWAIAPFGGGIPLAQYAARYQGEALNLFSRRASAYLEYPARLSQCRSPAELWREQIGFLSAMQRDYFEAAQHVLGAMEQKGTETQSPETGVQPVSEPGSPSENPGTSDVSDANQVEPRAA